MNQKTDFDDVTSMEEDAKYRIIEMEDESDPQSTKIVNDISEKIAKLYDEFRIWMKDYQEREAVQKRIALLKEESERLLVSAKLQLVKLKENEDIQRAVDRGIQVASDAGTWFVDTVGVCVKEVMKQENVQKFSENVNDKFIQFKEDERVKAGIKSFKIGTLKLAGDAYEGLKKVLHTDDINESETEESENEKNNNL